MSWRWILFYGIFAVVVVVSALVIRERRQRETPAYLKVFHWIPGPDPLKLSPNSAYPGPSGTDPIRWISPSLLTRLRESGIGGELILVGELEIGRIGKPISGAILLRELPTRPFTIQLVDSGTVVYTQEPSGLTVFPAGAAPWGSPVTLTPSKNAQVDLLEYSGGSVDGISQTGVVGIWWR